MAVTGVFNADFSQFFGAVTEANTKLDSLETNTTQTSTAVKGLEQSFGTSSIQLRQLGDAASATTPAVNSISEAYRQFDGALAAAGVNIGPQVKGLEDIANAAGKSVTELGALATAGLAVGAAMTGWKIGRMIADFFELDEKISKAAVSLGLFGDVAAATAGAKQDTINRAIAQGAAETINYTEAIKFNTIAAEKNAAQKVDWTGKLAAAYKEVRGVNEALSNEIAIAKEAGATTEDLTNKYGLSSTALKILADKHDEAAKATDRHREAQEKLNKDAAAGLKDFQAQTDVAKAWEPIVTERIQKRDAAAVRKAEDDAKALQAQGLATQALAQHTTLMTAAEHAAGGYTQSLEEVNRINLEAAAAAQSLADEQAKIDAENKAVIDSANAAAKAHTDAGDAAAAGTAKTVEGYQAVQQQITITGEGMKEWINLMRYTAQAQAILGEGHLFTTQSQRDRVAAIPSFAGGVENFDGGLAKVHAGELLVNLPGGTSVIPKGQGGNVTMANTFNLVDSESNLARRVSELIMRSVRAGTQLGTT